MVIWQCYTLYHYTILSLAMMQWKHNQDHCWPTHQSTHHFENDLCHHSASYVCLHSVSYSIWERAAVWIEAICQVRKIICPAAAFKEGGERGIRCIGIPCKGLSFHASPQQNKWPNQIERERGGIKLFEWKRWSIHYTIKDKDRGQHVQILQIRSVCSHSILRLFENAYIVARSGVSKLLHKGPTKED